MANEKLLQLEIKFTAQYEAKLYLPEKYTEDDLQDAIAAIDIPENKQCSYCFISFKPDMESVKIVRELILPEETINKLRADN